MRGVHTIEIGDSQGESLMVEYEVIEERGPGRRWTEVHVLSELPSDMDRETVARDIEERLQGEHEEHLSAWEGR